MRAWLVANGRNRAIAAAALAIVLMAGGAAAVVALTSGGSQPASGAARPTAPADTATQAATATATVPASPTPIKFAGILDGVPMSESEWTARKDLLPIAVMIDNSPDAFPHAGLDKADVVYEAFVEGGITRFMAVYWRQEASYIEPIRSARTPFVVWADELGALYAHAGEAETDNAANAAGQLYEWKIFDMNAFFGASSNAFYRDNDRYAPHNLVTSTTALREAAGVMGYAGPPTVQPWLFKADDAGTTSAPAAQGIEINFQGSRYPWQLVQWHWDPATRTYLRFQFGGPHIDAKTKEQLRFKNIVVMQVPSQVVDENGHVLLDQFGSGPATVFLDGKQVKGTWKKADRKSRTRFYDENGKEIAFDRGSTFIEVIGLASSVTVTATVAELPAIPAYVPPPPAPPATPDEETPTDTPTSSPTTAGRTPGASSTPSSSATPAGTGTVGGTTPTVSGTTSPVPGGTESATAAPSPQTSAEPSTSATP